MLNHEIYLGKGLALLPLLNFQFSESKTDRLRPNKVLQVTQILSLKRILKESIIEAASRPMQPFYALNKA